MTLFLEPENDNFIRGCPNGREPQIIPHEQIILSKSNIFNRIPN
jgi:hypothetical protein